MLKWNLYNNFTKKILYIFRYEIFFYYYKDSIINKKILRTSMNLHRVFISINVKLDFCKEIFYILARDSIFSLEDGQRNRRRTVRDHSLEVVRGKTSIILKLERNKSQWARMLSHSHEREYSGMRNNDWRKFSLEPSLWKE